MRTSPKWRLTMTNEEVVKFLCAEIEPVSDVYSRRAYRASVCLRDGTYLPCVMFRNFSDIVDLAIRRFNETRNNKSLHESMGYRAVVKSFVATGNRVDGYDIARVEKSPYAIPAICRNKVWSAGETRMGWISFTGLMDDGKGFWFGTSYHIEFFEMPEGYTASQMIDVLPHKSLSGQYLRERPFFDCYLEM